MKWMAIIALIVFVSLFVLGVTQIVVSLVRRESRAQAPGAILGLALVLNGIGGLLQWLLGSDSFFAHLASIFGGIGLTWWIVLEIKRKVKLAKPIELKLGFSKEASSRDHGSAEET